MDIQEEKADFEAEFRKTDFYKMNLVNCFCFINDRYVWDEVQAAWEMWQATKAQAVPEGFVLVEIKDLRDVISNAGDAMMNEETSSVYDRTGEPSTWFDHYTLAEKRVLKAIEAQEQKG